MHSSGVYFYYFREKSGHPGKDAGAWLGEVPGKKETGIQISPLTQCPASSILTSAEKGTAFPDVVPFFPFRYLCSGREAGERVSVHLSWTALSYLCFALGDLICRGRPLGTSHPSTISP